MPDNTTDFSPPVIKAVATTGFEVIKSNNAFVAFGTESPLIFQRPSPFVETREIERSFGFYHDDSRFVRTFDYRFLHADTAESLDFTVVSCTKTPAGVFVYEVLVAGEIPVRHTTLIQNDTWLHYFEMPAASNDDCLALEVSFAVDCEDFFEVRGALSQNALRIPIISEYSAEENNGYHGHMAWHWAGRDGQTRSLKFYGAKPAASTNIENTDASGMYVSSNALAAKTPVTFALSASRHDSHEEAADSIVTVPPACADATHHAETQFQTFKNAFVIPKGLPPRFQAWISKAVEDMYLLQGLANGYPCTHAGIPLFATIFGRDSLIASEQSVAVSPHLAQATLQALSVLQAVENEPRFDADIGKILHEYRFSERCRLGDIPFGRYYGSVDSTPLYISLCARYLEKTHNEPFLKSISASISLSVGWLWQALSKGRFLTYKTDFEVEGKFALADKGWKDGAPILLDTGKRAAYPIAVSEAQGYGYRALIDTIKLVDAGIITLENGHSRAEFLQRAATLKQDFDTHFWMENRGTYALAIAGDGSISNLVASNPSHLLRCDIITDMNKAHRVAQTLTDTKQLFSRWGIRTLSKAESAYDPTSYQLGGVWPHDTCEALRGLIHIGAIAEAQQVYNGLLDLAESFAYRLPEVITGYDRMPNEPCQIYANTCSPQAWSASIPMALLAYNDVLKL